MKKFMAILLAIATLLSMSAFAVVAEDDTTTESGMFDSLDKLSGFTAEHVKYYFNGKNGAGSSYTTLVTATEDGNVHLVAADPADDATDLIACVDFNYWTLIGDCYTGFPEGLSLKAKKELVPNRNLMNEDAETEEEIYKDTYKVIAIKVKRSEAAKLDMPDIYMYYHVGDALSGGQFRYIPETMVWPEYLEAADETDEYEYFVFDLTVMRDFQEDYINAVRFVWLESLVYDDTVAADYTMDICAFNMYKTLDEAVADLNLKERDDAPVVDPEIPETESDSETDEESSDTEVGDDESATTPAETTPVTETEASGGCGSVVGLSAAAVVLSAVAAAVVLKKKD